MKEIKKLDFMGITVEGFFIDKDHTVHDNPPEFGGFIHYTVEAESCNYDFLINVPVKGTPETKKILMNGIVDIVQKIESNVKKHHP